MEILYQLRKKFKNNCHNEWSGVLHPNSDLLTHIKTISLEMMEDIGVLENKH